jgi:Fe-S-cluster containining protein
VSAEEQQQWWVHLGCLAAHLGVTHQLAWEQRMATALSKTKASSHATAQLTLARLKAFLHAGNAQQCQAVLRELHDVLQQCVPLSRALLAFCNITSAWCIHLLGADSHLCNVHDFRKKVCSPSHQTTSSHEQQ